VYARENADEQPGSEFFLRNQDLENEDSIGLGSMVFNQYIHIYLMYLYIYI